MIWKAELGSMSHGGKGAKQKERDEDLKRAKLFRCTSGNVISGGSRWGRNRREPPPSLNLIDFFVSRFVSD